MRTLMKAIALAMAISLAGCASPGQTLYNQAALDAQIDLNVACHDRIVTLSYIAQASISVYPPRIDVCRGYKVRINIVPKADPVANPVSSASAPGNPAPTDWLNAMSGDGASLELTVSPQAVVGATYKYGLTIGSVGSIDPTFRIIN